MEHDYASASARFTCARDASHTDSAAAAVTSQTTDPDCVNDGRTDYTASATFDGQSYENSCAVTLPAPATTGTRRGRATPRAIGTHA